MAITTIDDSNYKDMLDGQQTVVKFYADWCGSCRMFAPKYKRLSADESFASLAFAETNAEHNPEFRKTAEVNNLPYFAFYENGVFKGGITTAKEDSLREFIAEVSGVQS